MTPGLRRVSGILYIRVHKARKTRYLAEWHIFLHRATQLEFKIFIVGAYVRGVRYTSLGPDRVEIAGRTMTLHILSPAEILPGRPIAVSYDARGAGEFGARLRGTNGVAVESFNIPTVTRTATGPIPPVLSAVQAAGTRLTMTFDGDLDGAAAPAGRRFRVLVQPWRTRWIVGTGTATVVGETVTVTLASAVAPNEGIHVFYSPGDDANPLRANPLPGTSTGPKVKEIFNFYLTDMHHRRIEPKLVQASVTGVALVSDAGSDATYAAGETVQVALTFGEAVAVDTESGTPRLKLDLDKDEDSGERWAAYEDGSGSDTLTFTWEAAAPDESAAGVAVLADTLDLNGGTIASVATQTAAALGHVGLDHDPAHRVDAAPPQLLRGEIDGGTMTLYFSEALDPDSTGGEFHMRVETPEGGVVGFRATGDVVVDGATVTVGMGESSPRAQAGLERNRVRYVRRADGADGALRDMAGNPVKGHRSQLYTPDAVETRNVEIDLANVTRGAPRVTGVAVMSNAGADATYGLGERIRIRVGFSGAVTVTGSPGIGIDMDPAEWGEKRAIYESGSGSPTLVFVHEVVEPNLSRQGIAVLADTLALDGGAAIVSTVTDDSALLGHAGLPHDPAHKVDWRLAPASASAAGAPAVTGVTVVSDAGSDATYLLGEVIRVRLTFSEAVKVTGTPRVAIDMDPAEWGEKQAAYEGARDTAVLSLTFAHEVVEPNLSRQGIAVLANSLELNGGTIRLAGGANAALGHSGLGHDSDHKVDWRPDISVADARANEGADAAAAFEVSLSRAFTGAEHRVTVDYATADGSATAGEDYTAASGTLTFTAGERVKTVSVAILDDSHDEGEETFTLSLSNATGAHIGDGEATGTIVNTDPMPRAWLARFGRTVAEQVVDAVGARLAARGGGGAQARIAGQELTAAGGLDAEESARLADQELARWLAGTPEQPRTMTGGELLAGSAFAVTSAAAQDRPAAALWGRGGWSRFEGREGSLSVDGEVTTALLGAELASGAWLGGVMLSHARGDGSYRADAGAGTAASTLTAVHPYVGVDLSERLTAWAAGGLGLGGLTLTPDGAAALETDLSLLLAALGARGRLVEPAAGSGFSLAIETDAYWVRTSSAAASGLAETHADATRIRLGLDGGYRIGLGRGGTVEPTVAVGVRHDGGDAETGYGMDLGGGLAWSAPALGLSARVGARGLLTAEFDGFRDLGLSGSLAWDSDSASDRGPSLTVTQTVGAAATGGIRALLGRPTLAGLAATGDGLDSRRLDLRAGYGFAAAGDRFTLTPEFGLGLSDAGRDYTLGVRLGLAQRAPASFELGLEATRRESADHDAKHRLGLTMTASW